MPDQAHDLRQLTTERRSAPSPSARRAFVVAVAGGKSETVAMSLAAASVESGRRAVFIARDPCGKTAEQFIDSLDDNRIEADLAVIDLGNSAAGMGKNICRRSDQVVVVANWKSADLLSAYKTIAALAGAAEANGGDSPGDRIRLLINDSPSAKQADAAHKRIAWAARRFLGLEIRSAGYVERGKLFALKRISRFCVNLRALSVDTIRELLMSDSLLKWRKRSDFNSRGREPIAEQLEMDF